MRIHLIEPLRVPEEKIKQLAQPLIDAGHEFKYFDNKTTDPNELIARSEGADIVTIANNPYPAEVIAANPQIQLLNVAFTGVDHVDAESAKENDIQVANASGYANTAVSELVIALTLALYRQIPQSNEAIRQGENFSGPIQGQEIKGKTVGIIGTGNIGLETAKLFKAFGANLIAYSRTEKEEAKELGITYTDLDTLLKTADIISVHLPLNDHTKNFLSQEKLSLIKDSAILINAARGPIIDNAALADLLNNDQIAGAGIDVFDGEPPLADDYPLLKAKNTVLTPHIAFLSDEAMVARAEIAFANIQAFIDGKPENIVEL
ncbi:2-hydroxyacid dehydrogenase [Aerococcus kribbianus]|uniref:2-hydroxyacid dehydrogenase n=1 Tax=Aerococcus kribbianus TaxID=2999064 RepID=A0A9X3FUD6_9LACT|nr:MULTISPECIES: 2-hydroxyacid dehydrogenase [unclassified Aerococcus]MCZ0717056.1 2-hydroxyacid dehydrogenase [Aerococcus sp. YH-aer221]MCZ0725344.1 2-hydroxyacid dehydrogenase [Aerococcus sp. YH-aer222]